MYDLELGDKDALTLSRCFGVNMTLCELYLDENEITDVGAEHLSFALVSQSITSKVGQVFSVQRRSAGTLISVIWEPVIKRVPFVKMLNVN